MITIITWRSDHLPRESTKYFRLVVKPDASTPAGVEVRDIDVLGAEQWKPAGGSIVQNMLATCIALRSAGRVTETKQESAVPRMIIDLGFYNSKDRP